jgi:hypothetical protein
MRWRAMAVVFLMVLFWSESGIGQTLHILAAGDDSDSSLGSITPGVLQNIKNLQIAGDTIATQTGLKLSMVTLRGSEFSCAEIEGRINSMDVKTDDVVIFYYSGHGAHPGDVLPGQRNSPWLYCNGQLAAIGPNLEDYAEKLEGKGARLVIAVADACNFIVPPAGGEQKGAPNSERLKQMYLHFKGTVMVFSAKVGQYAFYLPSGGFFSNNFLPLISQGPGGFDADISKVISSTHSDGVDGEKLWIKVIEHATEVIDVGPNQTPQTTQQGQGSVSPRP